MIVIIPEVGIDIEMGKQDQELELCQMTEEHPDHDSNSRVSTNRDRLRCYRCGEYDHFAQECPNSPTNDEMGQSDSEQVSMQMLTSENPSFNSGVNIEHLNL